MMINAGGGMGQRIPIIADQGRGGAIQNNGQRVWIQAVGHGIHHAVLHEGIAPGFVAHHVNLFFGIVFQQQVLEPDLAAQSVPVGVFVAMQNDHIMRLDQGAQRFKHE